MEAVPWGCRRCVRWLRLMLPSLRVKLRSPCAMALGRTAPPTEREVRPSVQFFTSRTEFLAALSTHRLLMHPNIVRPPSHHHFFHMSPPEHAATRSFRVCRSV